MADITGMLRAAAGSSSAIPEAEWNVSYLGSDPDYAWNISKRVLLRQFSVSTQESAPSGLFFKSDGTKVYIIGTGGDEVNEYTLSTPWAINTASFVQLFSVATEEITPEDLFFKPDGTKMYVLGSTGDDVNEYSLSTAWDISTASYTQNFSISGKDTDPKGLFFKSDGTKMYFVGNSSDSVHEYDLSTAWDISTASFLQSFSINGQESAPHTLYFKPDGTKMYVAGLTGDDVNEYTLSTAWNISTASFVNAFSLTPVADPRGLFFDPDGLNMYVVASTSISQFVFIDSFSAKTQELAVSGLFFKPDGTKMYICGTSGDDVNEYDLSTAWDVTTASFVQLFSVATQDTSPTGLFFKSDGTKMYVIGSSSDSVHEYTLSTGWNISTASFVQSFSVSTQESNPSDIFFKSDGTKMYISGAAGSDVNEYSLSTAWNISTASYTQNFSTSTQVSPLGLFFKSDGTKMYVSGLNGLFQYSLSTAWDISTASFQESYNITGIENPPALEFKDDGLVMFVVRDDLIYAHVINQP